MQAKLRGAARTWFNLLHDYDLSWADWKATLRQAFPRRDDFAATLKELVERTKRSGETMTAYYHAKLALCERCGFSGEKAISCIIWGLPLDLQANARAFKCRSPGELYSGFLAGLEHYQSASSSQEQRQHGGRKRSRRELCSISTRKHGSGGRGGGSPDSGTEGGAGSYSAKRLVRCYNCQEFGRHLSTVPDRRWIAAVDVGNQDIVWWTVHRRRQL